MALRSHRETYTDGRTCVQMFQIHLREVECGVRSVHLLGSVHTKPPKRCFLGK